MHSSVAVRGAGIGSVVEAGAGSALDAGGDEHEVHVHSDAPTAPRLARGTPVHSPTKVPMHFAHSR